jgi:hypothetical protein
MNSKRIALIVFLIGLVLLAVGFVIFFSQSMTRKNNLQTNLLKAPLSADQAANNQGHKNSTANPAAPKVFTDEQINQKIEATKQQINQQAKNRALTDSELYFLSAPRAAAIKALQTGQ